MASRRDHSQEEGQGNHLLAESSYFSKQACLQRNYKLQLSSKERTEYSKRKVQCYVPAPGTPEIHHNTGKLAAIALGFLSRALFNAPIRLKPGKAK